MGRMGRRGFALAAALLTIVLIGALIAGVFFATTEETMAGSAFRARQLALNSAETALAEIPARVTGILDSMQVGSAITLDASTYSGPATVYVSRLDSSLYWLVVEAEFGADATKSRRRIGLSVTMERDSSGAGNIARIPGQAWVELF